MKDVSRFWDRLASRYYRSPIKDLDAYGQKLTMSRHYFRPDFRVLEFGCGTGGTAIAHAPHVQHIDAIDISEKMLNFAQAQRSDKSIENVTFEKASIESFSAADASYDVILGLSILHLLEDRDAVLTKVCRLLKPGGIFISSTACMGDNLKFLKYVVPVGQALGLFPIIKVFTEEQLLEELQSSGFSIRQQWRPKANMAAFIIAEKEQIANSSRPVSIDAGTISQGSASDYINAISHS